jgi:hypothetical protein
LMLNVFSGGIIIGNFTLAAMNTID